MAKTSLSSFLPSLDDRRSRTVAQNPSDRKRPMPYHHKVGGAADAAPWAHAVFCSASPRSAVVSARSTNFCTLPVTVVGKASTKRT